MGDSFAAGEGNPHIRSSSYWRSLLPAALERKLLSWQWLASSIKPQWLEERCHRSLYSAPARAALEFANKNKQLAVAFFTVACSGATVPAGILGEYEGIEQASNLKDRPGSALPFYAEKSLAAQWTELATVLCRNKEKPCPRDSIISPDVIIMSIGVNDVGMGKEGFASIVKKLSFHCGNDTTCAKDVAKEVEDKLGRLSGKSTNDDGLLHKAYTTVLTELHPKALLVMAYPDPVTYATDSGEIKFCNESVGVAKLKLFKISESGSRFAQEHIFRPLNQAVADAVTAVRKKDMPIHFVQEIATSTSGHGFCADESYFNEVIDSFGAQATLSGGVHPNSIGHAVLSKILVKRMLEIR